MRTGPLLLLLALAPTAAAAPTAVRLSLNGDPSTSMAVSWNAALTARDGRVVYWTPGGTPRESRARLHPFGPQQVIAEAVLRDLAPSSLYHYRVGDPVDGFSPRYSFRTGAALDASRGSFRFAVVGDSRPTAIESRRGSSLFWPSLALRAASHLPAFVLHAGDITFNPRCYDDWRRHLEQTSPLSALFPIMYAIGNHDVGPGEGERAYFNRALQLPRSDRARGGSGTEDYYSFRYGNALFVVLSTETFVGRDMPMKKQADWMDRVLADTDVRWRFLLLHRPIYTAPPPLGHRPSEIGHNQALVTVINKHHIDIVFSGHNHFYERFAPSACSDPRRTAPCPVSDPARGTVFVTSGGAGSWTIPHPWRTIAARPAASGKHHYVLVEITDHQLQLEARGVDGAVFDTLRIRKSEQVLSSPAPAVWAPSLDRLVRQPASPPYPG